MNEIRIVIVDDHEPDLTGTCALLAAQRDFKIVGRSRDGYDALKLVSRLRPDVAVLDINTGYTDGSKLISLLKCWSPATSVILFTASENEEFIRTAIGNNVSGYLLKYTDRRRLAATIRHVSKGGCCITPKITHKVFRMFSSLIQNQNKSRPSFHTPKDKPRFSLPSMSRTEYKVLSLIARGWPDKKIAETLHLKEGTVRNCVSAAIQKAGLHNRTEMALYALRNGIVILK
jgi:DNA-binding NarL/FixJ family response regulator